jgi:hypothetical protein
MQKGPDSITCFWALDDLRTFLYNNSVIMVDTAMVPTMADTAIAMSNSLSDISFIYDSAYPSGGVDGISAPPDVYLMRQLSCLANCLATFFASTSVPTNWATAFPAFTLLPP